MALSACHSCRCAAPTPAECKPTTVPPTAHLGASDTYETKDCVYVKVDIPGMSKSDVKVTITDGMLHVVGQREKESTNKDINFFHIERQYGHFSRFFKLPDYSDLSRISATCDHGVLTIAVPKVTGAPAVAPADVTVSDKDDEGDGELNKEFAAVPISVFPTPSLGKLVILDSSMPLLDAVKMLSQYHILAAPVRDATKADDTPWTEKYMGILDMVSIVNYMLERLEATGDDFAHEAEKVQEFTTTTVAAAAKFARFGPFVPVDFSRGTLLDAMLLCGQHAIRRVPVVNSPGGDIVNIITQSALVQTLSANLDRFGSVAKQTLAKLGLASPARVFKVTAGDTLRAAFNLIKEYDISAVPVVDAETGKICGNISARDVRLVATSSKVYKLLNMTIRVYLDVVSDGAVNSAITCKPEDTMETVITRLVHSRIHRIYVVDGEDHIIRVVSLRNVLRKFVKEPQGFFGHYFS